MSPEELVSCIDFRYITDAITREEALEILRRNAATRPTVRPRCWRDGYPRLHHVRRLARLFRRQAAPLVREAVGEGWTHFKMKVGGDIEDDMRRAALIREEIGPEAQPDDGRQPGLGCRPGDREHGARSNEFDPYWIEEPTSPDDVLGHAASPRPSHRSASPPASTARTAIIFKQLLQADAIAFCQIDACRLGGVNEVIAVLLMAAKFGVPVCPHAGGVGLCEYVQHLSIFDYICVGPRSRTADPGVCGSPPRALRRSRGDPGRPLHPATNPRLLRRDETRVPERVRVPNGQRLGKGREEHPMNGRVAAVPGAAVVRRFPSARARAVTKGDRPHVAALPILPVEPVARTLLQSLPRHTASRHATTSSATPTHFSTTDSTPSVVLASSNSCFVACRIASQSCVIPPYPLSGLPYFC